MTPDISSLQGVALGQGEAEESVTIHNVEEFIDATLDWVFNR